MARAIRNAIRANRFAQIIRNWNPYFYSASGRHSHEWFARQLCELIRANHATKGVSDRVSHGVVWTHKILGKDRENTKITKEILRFKFTKEIQKTKEKKDWEAASHYRERGKHYLINSQNILCGKVIDYPTKIYSYQVDSGNAMGNFHANFSTKAVGHPHSGVWGPCQTQIPLTHFRHVNQKELRRIWGSQTQHTICWCWKFQT